MTNVCFHFIKCIFCTVITAFKAKWHVTKQKENDLLKEKYKTKHKNIELYQMVQILKYTTVVFVIY